MGWLDTILGRAPALQPVAPAPALAAYPSDDDARFAQASGFGYGEASEPFIQGKTARIFGTLGPPDVKRKQSFTPMSGAGLTTSEAAIASDALARPMDLSDPKNAAIRDKIGLSMARAALAANRSPVAAVGFDPRRAAMDTEIGDANIGGLYSPSRDSIYASASDPSALVHESMHRGFKMLAGEPGVKDALRDLPTEESMVRYLMAKQAGDPEKEGGPVNKRQREAGLAAMSSKRAQDAMDVIERAAQGFIARRRPMGPR